MNVYRPPSVPAARRVRCLCLSIALVFGQLASAEPPRLDQLTHLGVEDGLSHSTVWDIHQDARGFLWLATSNELQRYDGYQFRTYSHDPDDPESLSIDEVMRILESRDGMLWFGTRGGGLNRFDPLQERFTRYGNADDEPGPLATDTIGCLLEDSSDHIWVGTGDALHRLDPRSGSWRSWRHDPNDPDSLGAGGVQALAEDAAGRLWIGTGESGLHSLQLAEADTTGALVQYRHDPDDPYSLSSDEIFSLAIDKAGMLWVGTNGAVDRFDPTAQSCERLPLDPTDPSRQNSFVSALYEDGSGDLWIASHGAGLSHLDQATRTFTHYRHDANDPYGLKSDDLLDLHQDSTGILWITSRDGIDKFDRRREQFLTFRPNAQAPNGLRGDQIWAVVEDHAGVVWIGAFDGGLSGFDRTTGSVTHFTRADGGPTSLPNISITSVVEDSEGALWIGTRGGLSRLDRDRQRFVHYRHDPQDAGSLPENFIYSLLVDRTDTVWIGHGDQVSRFDRDTESFTAYRHDPADGGSLSSEEVYGVFEDRTGDLWVATFGGLNRLDAEGSFTHIRHDPADRNSLSSDQVTWLHHATSGIYWIATIGGGLSRWDRERGEFRHFREKDGLSDDSVVGILEDDAGHLWIAASNGLNRFDPITEQFTTFGVEDGLHGDIFYIGPAFRSTSGEMFLGGVGGLSAFFPDQIRGDPSPPKVVLTDFRLLNLPVPLRHRDPDSPLAESITATRELTLDYRDKVFSVEFAALHYASPKDNRYTYRLAGFDDDWIATRADQRFAQYTNLDPGPYELQVKASNKDGVWSETPVTLQLRVLPPPWKTWWAYSLYSLALASIVVGYLHWQRVKLARERALNTRLREVDRLKDEFLANTSHELRTPLYGIVGIAESLLDGAAGPVGEAMRSNLGMIVNSGRRLSGLVNDILDFSKMSRRGLELQKKAVDLKALTDVVLTLSKPLLGDKDLQLLNTIDPGLPAAEGDENRLQQILLNLLSNAIKFTESGRVEVSAVAEEGRLTVRVLDTGIGISQDHQEHIFESFEQADASTERQFGGTGLGLAVTKELVALHGGSVWVESVPGEGSSFFFTLPIAEGSAPSSPTESIVDTGVLAGIEAAVPGAAAEPPPDDGARDDRHRILIVDDEPVIRQVLVNHLTASELSTRQATGGAAALRLLEREHFDLVLLDVMMPRMSGYEVCRRIRRHHPPQELPVIFLTAKNQVADLVAGFAAGANDFLTKPISKSELLARVQTHLDLLFVHRSREQLVAERTAQLAERNRLLTELETRNAELTRFNYAVSHDLKNPLVTIRNFTGVLRRDVEGGRDERLQHDIDRIETAASKMQTLIDELLKLARAGHQTAPPQAIPFADLVREALDQLAEKIADARVRIDVAANLPVVQGDRIQLAEVVENLLDNALKYMGSPPDPRVEIGYRGNGQERVFFVRDNGRGIDPRYHEKIFGLFERLDPTKDDGTGLGLALVRQIVENHGGRVWVESTGRDEGSEFCFTLPCPGSTPGPGSTPAHDTVPH